METGGLSQEITTLGKLFSLNKTPLSLLRAEDSVMTPGLRRAEGNLMVGVVLSPILHD